MSSRFKVNSELSAELNAAIRLAYTLLMLLLFYTCLILPKIEG